MLLENLYKIKDQYSEDQILITRLVFLENHYIYNGHFPNNPIIPGVCLLQTAKEIYEKYYTIDLHLSTLVDVKFLKLIVPRNSNLLTYTIYSKPHEVVTEIKVVVTITDNSETYTKATVIYSII